MKRAPDAGFVVEGSQDMAAQKIGSVQGREGRPVTCPKCGSDRVRVPKWSVWTGFLGALLGSRITCTKCGHKWKA